MSLLCTVVCLKDISILNYAMLSFSPFLKNGKNTGHCKTFSEQRKQRLEDKVIAQFSKKREKFLALKSLNTRGVYSHYQNQIPVETYHRGLPSDKC